MLDEKENVPVHQEIESACAALKIFTDIEIQACEKVSDTTENTTSLAAEQQPISALRQQTTLPKVGWRKFKSLFEKAFPLFFQKF